MIVVNYLQVFLHNNDDIINSNIGLPIRENYHKSHILLSTSIPYYVIKPTNIGSAYKDKHIYSKKNP